MSTSGKTQKDASVYLSHRSQRDISISGRLVEREGGQSVTVPRSSIMYSFHVTNNRMPYCHPIIQTAKFWTGFHFTVLDGITHPFTICSIKIRCTEFH